MSELKVHKAYNRWLDEEMPTPNDDLICNEVYLKSEADKVIAELKKVRRRKMDKRTFKICEAVHLGLEHYYMGKKDRRTLTNEDYELAKRILPTLPEGWYRERHEWDSVKW